MSWDHVSTESKPPDRQYFLIVINNQSPNPPTHVLIPERDGGGGAGGGSVAAADVHFSNVIATITMSMTTVFVGLVGRVLTIEVSRTDHRQEFHQQEFHLWEVLGVQLQPIMTPMVSPYRPQPTNKAIVPVAANEEILPKDPRLLLLLLLL
jgi:hypothetical protein